MTIGVGDGDHLQERGQEVGEPAFEAVAAGAPLKPFFFRQFGAVFLFAVKQIGEFLRGMRINDDGISLVFPSIILLSRKVLLSLRSKPKL